MSRRSLAAPSLRVGRPVGRRAGRPAPPFSATQGDAAETTELSEIVRRLRDSLSGIDSERRAIERGAIELLDPRLRLGTLEEKEVVAKRYLARLVAELQGANVGLEELVLNLRTVLGKRFQSRFVRQSEADLQDQAGSDDRSTATGG
jgi:hypothetical protein